jgi:hypothetical protein
MDRLLLKGVDNMNNVERYHYIKARLAEAKTSDNKRQITYWRNRLNEWQQTYGAYAPIDKNLSAHQYD